jgi:histidinol-phosphate aminotransferase
MPLSRRQFARFVAVGVGAAAVAPNLARAKSAAAGRVVRLSSNENPYGPSPVALDAMRQALALSPRYPDDEMDELIATIARLHGVADEQVVAGAGSSEILKVTASAAFVGSNRKVVMADPTFESIEHYARSVGAGAVKVPLNANFEHDLAKMAAVADAGAIYVCNPNNPTGSITPKQAVRSFLDAVPASTIVLVDEAYHHYVDSADYESVIGLIPTHPNLIVARTFSKIYAMAGLRAGYAVASRELAGRLRNHQAFDALSVVALTGARASLGDAKPVADGKKRNTETRQQTVAAITKLGYSVVPSEANFIMIDTRRPVRPLIGAMRDGGVRVGRLFPALPNHLRVTIGTPEEMERFLSAFKAVTVTA